MTHHVIYVYIYISIRRYSLGVICYTYAMYMFDKFVTTGFKFLLLSSN